MESDTIMDEKKKESTLMTVLKEMEKLSKQLETIEDSQQTEILKSILTIFDLLIDRITMHDESIIGFSDNFIKRVKPDKESTERNKRRLNLLECHMAYIKRNETEEERKVEETKTKAYENKIMEWCKEQKKNSNGDDKK